MKFTSGYIISLLVLIIGAMGDEEPKPNCRQFCPRILSPVCGTIKNFEDESVQCTFANDCLLEVLTCNTKQELIKEEGPCNEDDPECPDLIRGL